MQTTKLDPILSATLQKSGKDGLMLLIVNKNYPSWSKQPWWR